MPTELPAGLQTAWPRLDVVDVRVASLAWEVAASWSAEPMYARGRLDDSGRA